MRKCALITIFFSTTILLISNHQTTFGKFPISEIEKLKQAIEFSDNQKELIPTLYTGEKAEQIKQNLEAIFVPCSIRERKRAEKNLIELVSTLKLPEKDSVDVDRTWSSPLNFKSTGSRHAIITFLHIGSGVYISLWILCESDNGIKCFSFEGEARYCGYWQIVNDINNDAVPELIVKHHVGDYEGGVFDAVWSAIYKWDGDNYVRADNEFPDYYAREVVPQYQKILIEHQDLNNNTDPQKHRIYQKCEYVLEKAESIAKKVKEK